MYSPANLVLPYLGAFSAGLGFLSIGVTAAKVDRPNILLIVSEDNGPELGCYGDPFAVTPNLDELADEGVRFANAFVPQAGCSQSRASFLTGLYPHQHGQIGLATWGFRLFDADTPNLPRRLKAAGYRTGLIGKLHINPASAFDFDFHEITGANFARKQLADYRRLARDFMDVNDKPFFLSVNYPDAHDPWIRQVAGIPERPLAGQDVRVMPYMGVNPPALREMVADYYNCLARLDTLVGDLLHELERSGKSENTLVIYLGDHGADMLRGKRTCYEGGLRIPLIIRWPGRIRPQVRDQLVSTVDLMPTLLTIAKASPVSRLAGKDLTPLFGRGQPEWRKYLFAEYHTHATAVNYFPQRCVRDQRYKLIESLVPDSIHPDYEDTLRKLRGDHERRKSATPMKLREAIETADPTIADAYRLSRRPPRYQLFDLKEDPYEFNNLAEDPAYSATLQRLVSRLDRWRKDSADPLMDRAKLRRLTNEVLSVKTKSQARKHEWLYPQYLLD
ncbi:MAG: sulfatase [Planctomycetota bacterium]